MNRTVVEGEDHKELKKKLMEIGSIEGYHTEKEFECGIYSIDVVWKKTSHNDNPAYAFEVHIDGNLEHALTALKTANDKWNCKLILVTTGSELQKARMLLETTFHEIGDDTKLVKIREVGELHENVAKTKVLKDIIGYKTSPR